MADDHHYSIVSKAGSSCRTRSTDQGNPESSLVSARGDGDRSASADLRGGGQDKVKSFIFVFIY